MDELVEVRDPRRHLRRAITVVELLVGMALIGALIALLLPAVQRVRKSSNRITVANKLDTIEEVCTDTRGVDRVRPSVLTTPAADVAPRRIRCTVEVRLTVDDLDKAGNELLRTARERKDLMVQFEMPLTTKSPDSRCCQIRVPRRMMRQVVDALAKHGTGQSQSRVDSEDLTARCVELDAGLAKRKAQEQVLSDYLEEQHRWSKASEDVREIEEELAATRREIARIETERRQLERMTTSCAINVTMERAANCSVR